MGTNYYQHGNVCERCGRGDAPRHIGKSSWGWCFSLHVYPEDGINSLEDWKRILKGPGTFIEDEYGIKISLQCLLKVITERELASANRAYGYSSVAEFHELNHSEDGPNGLFRHRLDEQRCIGHGEGTWDLIVGYFS